MIRNDPHGSLPLRNNCNVGPFKTFLLGIFKNSSGMVKGKVDVEMRKRMLVKATKKVRRYKASFDKKPRKLRSRGAAKVVRMRAMFSKQAALPQKRLRLRRCACKFISEPVHLDREFIFSNSERWLCRLVEVSTPDQVLAIRDLPRKGNRDEPLRRELRRNHRAALRNRDRIVTKRKRKQKQERARKKREKEKQAAREKRIEERKSKKLEKAKERAEDVKEQRKAKEMKKLSPRTLPPPPLDRPLRATPYFESSLEDTKISESQSTSTTSSTDSQ
jgi:hypothetical protein